MNLSHFVRTDWFYRTIILVLLRCASTTLQSATRLEQNTATRLKLWDIGYGLLAMGYWLWAIGDWLLNMGGKAAIRASTLYTLHPTLYALHY